MKGPYWHDQNPWKDELIYITLDDVEKLWAPTNRGPVQNYLRGFGGKYDAYILPGGSMGIRFGAEGHEYMSPSVNQEKLIRFLFNKVKASTTMLQALQIAEESYENFVAAGKDDGTLGVIRSAITKAKGKQI